MSDLAPILLRPSAALAAAMTAAAEARGISRQAWMLTVLEGACSEYMTALTPDDVPLFEVPSSTIDPCPECHADVTVIEGDSRGYAVARPCGHVVKVTIWPELRRYQLEKP